MAGVRRSPRPVPSAVPPISANGTSLPTRAAKIANSGGQDRCPQRITGDQRAGRVGASAGRSGSHRDLLADMKPAPLVTPEYAASVRAACIARLESSRGTCSEPNASAVMPRSPRPNGDHLVVEKTRGRQVARSWKPSGRRGPTASATLTFAGTRTVTDGMPGGTRRWTVRLAHRGVPPRSGRVVDGQLLATRPRISPPRAGWSLPTRVTPPSVTMPRAGSWSLREGRVHDGEHIPPVGSVRRIVPDECRPTRSRRSGAGQNTVRATVPGRLDVGVPRRLHRWHAVRPAARSGGQPVCHLLLDHDQTVPETRERFKKMQQYRNRHVVRKVGDAAWSDRPRVDRSPAGRPPGSPRAGWPGSERGRRLSQAAHRPASGRPRSPRRGRPRAAGPASTSPAPNRPRPRRRRDSRQLCGRCGGRCSRRSTKFCPSAFVGRMPSSSAR